MGLERHAHDGILFLAVAMVRTPEQEAYARPRVSEWLRAVREFADTIEGGILDWTYLSYADPSQDPLGSYGKENIKFLKDVADKYDPHQAFQKLVPGGFKISNVKS